MSTKHIKTEPKLTIVGIGPGDADLITVKGIRAISSADVVLYDHHANAELLKYAPVGAKKIYAGKRNGDEGYTQEQLNTLIVDLAFTHGHVVRLYSGDPFFFERASEEISYADLFNIEAEIIPGISGSTGIPGLQPISLTKVGVSESYWVIAGTMGASKLLKNIKLAARSSAALVVLRGLDKLDQIVEAYKALGEADTPAAVIQNGSLPGKNLVLGTIDSIGGKVREENISSPAVIIIGEVVRLHPLFAYLQAKNSYLLN